MKRRALLLAPVALAACTTRVAGPASDRSAGLIGPQGWAATAGGTRGGVDALREHRLDVHNLGQLQAALALGDTPKLLRIHGRIDLSAGQGEAHFRDPAHDLDAYCAAFAPAAWGRRAPAGPLEDARRRSAARQAAAITLRPPPRTALVGATADAGFTNGMLLLDGVHDIVVQGLHFGTVLDHFPGWDPLDGAQGAWNSDYDTLSLRRSHHVWVDHCSFDSGGLPKPLRLGRPFEQTDGLLDITRMSDLVTVSWCRFARHDKTMLIGSSDTQTDDIGRLRVTLHHNLFERCNERTPRVRFGHVHVANNHFVAPDATHYGYSIGVGQGAQIVSEANAWDTDPAITPGKLVRALKGTQFVDHGSLHNGRPIPASAWSAFESATFVPPPLSGLLPAADVAAAVNAGAGPSRLVHNHFL